MHIWAIGNLVFFTILRDVSCFKVGISPELTGFQSVIQSIGYVGRVIFNFFSDAIIEFTLNRSPIFHRKKWAVFLSEKLQCR
jgi:hypothetical protein